MQWCCDTGHAYQDRLFPKSASAKGSVVDTKDSEEANEMLRQKVARDDIDLEDYYALLGLSEENVMCSERQIKDNWAKLSVLCHPDKAQPASREFAERRYKAMQLAASTMSTNSTRRAYDSAIEFDDTDPSEKQGTGDSFFKVYGPVFQRNARFSEIKPVPELGDMNTPFSDVNKFYDFWFAFRSWRDFHYLDEHKPDDTTPREQRRHMERQNAKLRAGKKKEETKRVSTLVENAMRKDPRVIAKQAEEDALKEAKKQEKKAMNQAKHEQVNRIKEEELKAKEDKKLAEEQAAKDQKVATRGEERSGLCVLPS